MMLKKIGYALLVLFSTLVLTGVFFCILIGLLKGTIRDISLWPYALGVAVVTATLCIVRLVVEEGKSDQKSKVTTSHESFLDISTPCRILIALASMFVLACLSLGTETLLGKPKLNDSLLTYSFIWSPYAILQFFVFPHWSRNRRMQKDAEKAQQERLLIVGKKK